MKTMILIAGCAMLAACADNSADETAPAEDVAMTAETTEAAAPDVTMRSYTWTGAEGEAFSMSIDGSNNYITEMNGDHADHGTVAFNEEGKICFTSAMDNPEAGCWTYNDLAVGSSMETTADDGRTLTVNRVDYVEMGMPAA